MRALLSSSHPPCFVFSAHTWEDALACIVSSPPRPTLALRIALRGGVFSAATSSLHSMMAHNESAGRSPHNGRGTSLARALEISHCLLAAMASCAGAWRGGPPSSSGGGRTRCASGGMCRRASLGMVAPCCLGCRQACGGGPRGRWWVRCRVRRLCVGRSTCAAKHSATRLQVHLSRIYWRHELLLSPCRPL